MSNNSILHESLVCTQFKWETFLFDPYLGRYQLPPLWVRVYMGAEAMNG